jgi:hypothetical protein
MTERGTNLGIESNTGLPLGRRAGGSLVAMLLAVSLSGAGCSGDEKSPAISDLPQPSPIESTDTGDSSGDSTPSESPSVDSPSTPEQSEPAVADTEITAENFEEAAKSIAVGKGWEYKATSVGDDAIIVDFWSSTTRGPEVLCIYFWTKDVEGISKGSVTWRVQGENGPGDTLKRDTDLDKIPNASEYDNV